MLCCNVILDRRMYVQNIKRIRNDEEEERFIWLQATSDRVTRRVTRPPFLVEVNGSSRY